MPTGTDTQTRVRRVKTRADREELEDHEWRLGRTSRELEYLAQRDSCSLCTLL